MMASDVAFALGYAFWYLTAALVVTLAVRMPMRRWFGAEAAYKTWLLVPAIVAAALAPDQIRPRVIDAAGLQLGQTIISSLPPPAVEWSTPLVWVWLAGAILLAAWFWRSHRAFVRRLGNLTQREGIFHSDEPFAGPALLGLWKPKMVVPLDFSTRYTQAEQRLIVAHEQVHANRGDAWANLLQAVLQCVFWFNPLVHLAAPLFRVDQELACDAAVIRTHPAERRAYASALLKSQDASFAPAVYIACHWRPIHPIKERVMSLQQAQPNHMRRIAGQIVIGTLIFTSTGIALASREDSQAASSTYRYAVETTFQVAGKSFTPRFQVGDGENIKVRLDGNGKPLTAEFQIRKTGSANTVQIKARIDSGTSTIAQPSLISFLGQPSRIRSDTDDGPIEVSLLVTELP